MKENFLIDKSIAFASRIIKLNQYLVRTKKEAVISRQIVRSGTSIGANVAESQQAQSRADFISKLNIALKETAETDYWLRLLHATEYLNDQEFQSVFDDCNEIGKMLTAILKSTKK